MSILLEIKCQYCNKTLLIKSDNSEAFYVQDLINRTEMVNHVFDEHRRSLAYDRA